MATNGFLTIKPHTLHKYNILRKYLAVCKIFDKHYSNFVYVDTHGGSGKVQLEGSSEWVDGSPLIAGNWTPQFPCHIVEIDPNRYRNLCASTTSCNNVRPYPGDCNKLITSILAKIPKGQKFVFCFVDPESLVYRGDDGNDCDQLCADTIQAIADFPRSELLLNFPLEALLRCAGDYYANPIEARAISTAERVTTYMGSESWKNLATNRRDRKDFLELYMNEILVPYRFKGAILIRSEQNNLPLYYLIYAAHNYTAAKIMRDVMMKEGNYTLNYDLTKMRVLTKDEAYPLTRFIFEKE